MGSYNGDLPSTLTHLQTVVTKHNIRKRLTIYRVDLQSLNNNYRQHKPILAVIKLKEI